jgi:hypothetical protein
VNLHDRVLDFEDFVRAKEDTLCDFIKQWNEAQKDIIAFAVQVLGRATLEIPTEVAIMGSLQKTIDGAVEQHERLNTQHQAAVSRISGMQDKLKGLTKQTKSTVVKQQRVRDHSQWYLDSADHDAANQTQTGRSHREAH